MGKLREEEDRVIRHALGLDRSPQSYRNSYVAGPGHDRTDVINSLVALGFMKAGGKMGDDTVYVVTRAGRAALDKTK